MQLPKSQITPKLPVLVSRYPDAIGRMAAATCENLTAMLSAVPATSIDQTSAGIEKIGVRKSVKVPYRA